ncbi:pyridoxal phosphate-dependent aminotransferase [Pseudonocardia halophobica]|uniref:Aminotransferase n=1 Tax=Pseudonocardia halophobica TaxID=29401 RepID=A0A9W6L529_9PSEU|nr:pyridoxal phosphate-dependent aminotransferase [Pseudonocardia halophobica]GLL12231.1 aminotransferase [Pseudonocardia halophobica]
MSAPATAAPSFEHLLERPDLVWMGQNTTHLEPPAEVLAALEESTRRREFQLYAPALGFERLRTQIVEDLGLTGADAWITDGAVGGLHHICTGLAGSVSQVVTSDPGWPWPARFAGLEGVPVTTLELYSAEQGYRVTAQQIAEVIEPRSLIYLIDPLNPLGSRYTRAELVAITDLARQTGSLVVHDCTYRHFASDHTLAAELYPEGTFTTYSFSKWLGLAGLRLGAVVAVPELLGRLTEVPSNPLGANIQAQRAAMAGLSVKEPWLARVRATNRTNQETVRLAVQRSGLGELVVFPSHGNFVAVDIAGSGWSADALCAAMLERNVFIRPGTYQSPRFGERFVKVSTSVPEEWGERFAAAWADLSTPASQA